MKTHELTPEQAAAILFGRSQLVDEDFDPMEAQFRSGADIAESLAAHFEFSGDDYERIGADLRHAAAIAETDKRLPDGTRLRCPECGCDTFRSWYYEGRAAFGAHVIIQNGERVEDETDVYDSEGSDDVRNEDCFSCQECQFFGPMSSLVAPGESTSEQEAEQEAEHVMTIVVRMSGEDRRQEFEERLQAIAGAAGFSLDVHDEDLTSRSDSDA